MLKFKKKTLFIQTIIIAIIALIVGIYAISGTPKIEGGISIGYDSNAYEARVTTDGGSTYIYYTNFESAVVYANTQSSSTIEILKKVTSVSSTLNITKPITL